MRSSLCLALLALAWGCGSEVPFPPGGGGIPPIIGVGGSAGSGGTGGMGGTGGSAGSGGAGGSGGTYALCLEIDCGDGNDCTRDVCDPADGRCSNPNEPDATPCELIGQPGVCVSGTCVIGTLCDGFDCSDSNQCTQDVCNPADGSCSNPEEPIGTPCDEGGIPGSCVHGVCDIST